MTLKIAFAGSPDFAQRILQQLADADFTPVAVFTQPDKAKGRGRKIQTNPVKDRALALGIPVLQPKRMKSKEAHQALAELQVDVLVVVAYGQILPQSILNLPRLGCLNVHASLLPRWRGAAPIERSVMAGDTETGVAIMKMEAVLDTGPVYRESVTTIDTTSEQQLVDLEATLADLGAEALIRVLEDFASGEPAIPTPQIETGVTYADKLTAEDREVDWGLPAEVLQRKIWALRDRLPVRVQISGTHLQLLNADVVEQTDSTEPQPCGCLVDANKKGIYIQCATDLLRVTRLRMEKGKGTELGPAEALNGYGHLFVPGHRFSSPSQ